MAATQEFVNSRVYPIEQSVTKLGESLAELKESMDALKFELVSRDGDWAGTKARVDEIGIQIEKIESEFQSGSSVGISNGTNGASSQSILRHPGFRNLECYSGDHKRFNKWRSKLRGILLGEDEGFRAALKLMESPEQPELPSIAEGTGAYESQIGGLQRRWILSQPTL